MRSDAPRPWKHRRARIVTRTPRLLQARPVSPGGIRPGPWNSIDCTRETACNCSHGLRRDRSIWFSPIPRSTSAMITTSTTTVLKLRPTSTGPGRGVARSSVHSSPTARSGWRSATSIRRDEGPLPPRARAVVAKLGDLVLYVWGPLHQEVQPQSRPLVLLREGPQTFYFQRPVHPRSLGAATGLLRLPGQPRRPSSRRHLDSPPAGRRGRLRPRERHVVRAAGLRHLQGTRRLARLPDARAASGPDHPRLLEPRRNRPRPLRRQRHDLDSRQEAGPPFPRLRALSRLCQRHRSSPRVREGGPVPRRRRRALGRGERTSTIQESSTLTFDKRVSD